MHFSDEFVISCGTVTLDLQARKVLVLFSRKAGEYLLPKGRKDIGEGLETTALRETFEESGYTCPLLPHTLPTLAPTSIANQVDSGRVTTEPFAVTQRTTNEVLKVIFWYLAQAYSSATQTEDTQMEDEDFETIWAEDGKALELLTFEDDRAIARRAMTHLGFH